MLMMTQLASNVLLLVLMAALLVLTIDTLVVLAIDVLVVEGRY